MPPGQTCAPCRYVSLSHSSHPSPPPHTGNHIGAAKWYALSRTPAVYPISEHRACPSALRWHATHVRSLLKSEEAHGMRLYLCHRYFDRAQRRVPQERRRLCSLQVRLLHVSSRFHAPSRLSHLGVRRRSTACSFTRSPSHRSHRNATRNGRTVPPARWLTRRRNAHTTRMWSEP